MSEQVAELLHGAHKEYVHDAPIAKLHPNPWNPNKMDDSTYRAERESIRIYGFIDPVTVRPHPEIEGEWQILDGEHRTRAAHDEGHDSCDLIVLHGLSDGEAEKLTIILNETRGDPDEQKLAELLKRIDDRMGRDELKLALPYDDDSLERMIAAGGMGGPVPDIELDSAPEPQDDPESKRGEVYELGPHRLMCGDSRNAGDLAMLMNHEVAHMVMADPADCDQDVGTRLREVLTNARLASDGKAALHLWFPVLEIRAALAAIAESGWEELAFVVRGKPQSTEQGFVQYKSQFESFYYCHKKGKQPRWYGPTTETTLWMHDAPGHRPVDVRVREVKNHTQPGHNVLELFGGRGSTMIACDVASRRAFVMEADPRFCDVIRKRWDGYRQAQRNLEWSEPVA